MGRPTRLVAGILPRSVDERHGPFRWSGPSNVSTIDLPVLVDRDLAIRMHVLHVLDHAALDTLRLFVNSERIDLVREETESGTFRLSGIVRPGPAHPVDRAPRIAIRLEKTRRPLDSGGTDGRRLGIAVNWIELGPAQAETHSTHD